MEIFLGVPGGEGGENILYLVVKIILSGRFNSFPYFVHLHLHDFFGPQIFRGAEKFFPFLLVLAIHVSRLLAFQLVLGEPIACRIPYIS